MKKHIATALFVLTLICVTFIFGQTVYKSIVLDENGTIVGPSDFWDNNPVPLGAATNALSTWTGSTNITTLGTVSTGAWNATSIPDGKIASALTGKTYNGLSITTTTGTFTLSNSKALTVSNTLTLSGSDGSTLNIGSGGTLGTSAFAALGGNSSEVPFFGAPQVGTLYGLLGVYQAAHGGNTYVFQKSDIKDFLDLSGTNSGDQAADAVPFISSAGLDSTDVAGALDELDTEKLSASSLLDLKMLVIPVDGSWGQTSSGTGASISSNNGIGLRIGSGTASGGYALARWTGQYGVLGGYGTNNTRTLPWGSRVRVSFVFSMVSDTNGEIRWYVGGQSNATTSSAAAGVLAARGIGIKIASGSLYVETHNGTSPTTSAAYATLTNSLIYHVLLDSDGAGNVACYLNGTYLNTATGGPTSSGSSNDAINIAAINTNTAASNFIDASRMCLVFGN